MTNDRLPAPGSRLPTLIDLASARFGGRTLAASDDFFGSSANLLKPTAAVFVDGKYTDRGKWMDGWETRRRRTAGHDWCVIQLGIPGVIQRVTVDTTHFRGNHPESCALDAVSLPATRATRFDPARVRWREILPPAALQGHMANDYSLAGEAKETRCTHIRLRIYPDGGVARLRLWGEARPDWRTIGSRGVDLAALAMGGLPLDASDRFFGEPLNLLMPGRPAHMGEGWETRRRRAPGHDWVLIRLGHRGIVQQIVVDTTHFKGNFPDACLVEACDAPALDPTDAPGGGVDWRVLVPRTKLRADTTHRFTVRDATPTTHVRLSIFPDGGVARLRVRGRAV